MKKIIITLFILNLTLFTSMDLTGSKNSALNGKYKNWLNKEVRYIITPTEKKVFNLLKTDREREVFIKMFWDHRDPDEHTSENEFKIEHQRRIKYANHHFGKGTPTPGWKTEMGRIYIILGEPNQIQNYEHNSGIYPVVIWFYQGMNKYGLPDAFNVVFFKQYGAGDFELYSPVKHGPSNLMVHYKGDINDYLSQYMELRELQKEVADVSLTLIEGQSGNVTRPSIASDILVHKKIKEMPSKKLDDQYASKLLQYKEYISMDHSAKYIRSSALLKVLLDKDGHYIVNYLIEPKRLSMSQSEDKLATDLLINGSVTDKDGKPVFNFEKTIPVRINEEQARSAASMLFALEDSFPLIPGDYRINLLLRNRLSKEFTSFEKEIHIEEKNSTGIGNLLLGNRIVKVQNYMDNGAPFTKNRSKISLSPRNDFIPGQNLYLFFQIIHPDLLKKGSVARYSVTGDKGSKLAGEIILDSAPDKQNIVKKIPLKGLKIDYYSIKVILSDPNGEILDLKKEDFYISPNQFLKRPWVVSQKKRDWINEKNSILGIQYSNKKMYKTALEHLGKAYFSNPSIIGSALNYASVLFKVKEYEKILNIGRSFLSHTDKHKFYTFMALSYHALGKYDSAIEFYRKYISYYGENVHILRSLEHCYRQSGDRDSAGTIQTRLKSILSENRSNTDE